MVFLKNNRFFFTFFAFWQGILLIYLFFFPKGQEFLLLNRFHHLYLDIFFKSITFLGDWPAYIFALAFLFSKLKFRAFYVVMLVSILVPITSYISKANFKQPRPAHYFQDKPVFNDLQKVDGVVLHTGFSSFPSGHTMSAFAVFSLLAFFASNSKRQIFLFLSLAILVATSRVYLIQHFVEDVWMGSLLGVMLAYIIFQVFHIFSATSKQSGEGVLQ
ncbi:MAG: phosphatase PAP2 family protein [Saprospiraceae bacterium]|nr:phosphatase PAP2 family protein [Saprospiraceae bacterium]